MIGSSTIYTHVFPMKKLVYFNYSNDYVMVASSSSTCMIGLGSNCEVYFVQWWSTLKTSIAKAAGKRTRVRVAIACSVAIIRIWDPIE